MTVGISPHLNFLEKGANMKYNVGMYGGKFAPFHLGHLLCLNQAAYECREVHLILFRTIDDYKWTPWDIDRSIAVCFRIAQRYANVRFHWVDTVDCYVDGAESMDLETPKVRRKCGGRIDAVYSSEPDYDPYFKRAYPEAAHRLVNPSRD